jgi:long-chain acyl-CoA synthetase
MRQKDLGIWQRFTWNDVYDRVRSFSLGLISIGLKAGETVAIIGENTPELFWADFGTLSAGAKMVCLYPDMTPDEMLYVLQHSEAVFLVAEDQEQVDKYLEIRSQLPEIRKVIYWDERGMWQYHDNILMEFKAVIETGRRYHSQSPDMFEQNVDSGRADDIALLSYTSGTTGIPKGVVLTHNWLLDHAYRVIMANDFKPFTQYLSYLSPAWITEHFFVTVGLLVPFVYNFPEEPETVLANIRELGAECLVFGPRQWESLASAVQVKMNDAGPIRRFIYKAGIHIGMSGPSATTWDCGKRILHLPAAPLPLRRYSIFFTPWASSCGISMAVQKWVYIPNTWATVLIRPLWDSGFGRTMIWGLHWNGKLTQTVAYWSGGAVLSQVTIRIR